MDRREFLQAIAGLSAAGLQLEALAAQLHARADAGADLRTLNPLEHATVSGIAEILLPETDSVGATAVRVDRFIDLLLTESMPAAERDRFLAGLAAINVRSQSLYGAPFPAAGEREQHALVQALDEQLPERAPAPMEAAKLAAEPLTAERAFALLKGLVVLGYFTAEPVAKALLIKAPIIPGRYDGCVSG